MADDSGATKRVDEASPVEMRDPALRKEIRRATIWLGLACLIALAIVLVQPLLLIFAAVVFASLLDGGVRLLGRVLPISRGWRLLIVVVLVLVFMIGTFVLTGVQVTEQVTQLRSTLELQANRFTGYLASQGLMPGVSDVSGIAKQALGSVGRVTSWVGTAIGALTSLFMILVLGLFIAMDPGTYARGVQWMVPTDLRDEFARTMVTMGETMRRLLAGRLLGMAVEGVATGIALAIGGVPMAMLLGIIAGILAFIPNIGAIGTYFVVQTIDGYVIVPMVAKRTVDLPPALTLGAQILASALFGILGLALADPMTAMLKTALERRSDREDEKAAD
jgi:predicted PurR-regulated permease PerM